MVREKGFTMHRLIRGGIAGVAATGTMSCAMWLGTQAGLLHTPPPKQITKRAQRKVGINPHALPAETFTASWFAAHLAYGTLSGAAYALLRPLLPGSNLASGLLYGGAVWAVNYLGLLPALGLFEPPDEHAQSQTAVMLAAHAVYGVTLAAVNEI